MHVLKPFLLVCLTPLFTAANPAATPTAISCNGDNCLNALLRNSVSASSFCATYTQASVTVVTGLPTYVPTSCIPSRVSSACTCVDLGPCRPHAPTQVVQDPSFENESLGALDRPQTDSPWSVSDTAGNGNDYYESVYPYDGNNEL